MKPTQLIGTPITVRSGFLSTVLLWHLRKT